jgi:predicted DNA-binding WGR domain protein
VEEAMADETTVRKVQTSWDRINEIGREKVGIILFLNIFKAAPAALQMFSFKDEKDLQQSKAFKRHCKVVVSTVGLAVAGLHDLDKLVPVLKSLGKFHGDLGKGIGAAHYGTLFFINLR